MPLDVHVVPAQSRVDGDVGRTGLGHGDVGDAGALVLDGPLDGEIIAVLDAGPLIHLDELAVLYEEQGAVR